MTQSLNPYMVEPSGSEDGIDEKMAKKQKRLAHPVPQRAGFMRWENVTDEERAEWAAKQSKVMKKWWRRLTPQEKNTRARALAKAHGLQTYTETQIKTVIRLWQDGLSAAEIEKRTKVHKMTISKVVTGKNWAYLTKGLNLRRRPKLKMKPKADETEKQDAA